MGPSVAADGGCDVSGPPILGVGEVSPAPAVVSGIPPGVGLSPAPGVPDVSMPGVLPPGVVPCEPPGGVVGLPPGVGVPPDGVVPPVAPVPPLEAEAVSWNAFLQSADKAWQFKVPKSGLPSAPILKAHHWFGKSHRLTLPQGVSAGNGAQF